MTEWERDWARLDHDNLPDPPGLVDVPGWGILAVLVLAFPLLVLYSIGVGVGESVRRLCR